MKKFFIVWLSLLALSCSKEEFDPSESFTKIYDSFRSDLEFYPIDVTATESGFLILASQSFDQTEYRSIQVIQLDEEGDYVNMWEPSNSIIPIGNIMKKDSLYHFFAVDPATFRVQLIKINENLDNPEVLTTGGNLYYPLAASPTQEGQFLLLSYDLDNQLSIISRIDENANIVVANAGYSIGAGSDVHEEIINHYLEPGRASLPFFCGEIAPGSVYFNGFYNYNLSLVFSTFGDTPSGEVQGQGSNGGIAMAKPIQGSNFAIFGFQFEANFIQPNYALNTTDRSSSIDILNSTVSEFKSRTPSDIQLISIGGDEYTIIAGETERRQVALYFYNATTGELAAIHKIGYLNPYTLSSLSIDDDNNLLVLGTTYVSGRFKRIYLTKISQDQLSDIVP